MRKISLFISIIILFSISYFIFNYNSTSSNLNEDTVIYYIPHQDDEVITFGVSIYSNINDEKNVQIVLLTDGSASKIRGVLNMTPEIFTTARDKEMSLALQALGVDLSNLHKQNFKDGELKVEQVEEVIKHFANKYPNASHKTFSYYDPHPDHSNAGNAIKNMLENGIVQNASFYIGPNFMPLEHIEIFEDHYEDSFYPFILAASRSYNINDDKNGFYGIGWKSVPGLFEFLEENPRSIYHK